MTNTATAARIEKCEVTPGTFVFTVWREGQKPVRFAGTVRESVKCGAKCRNSMGPSCTCSCGGHSHGKDRW